LGGQPTENNNKETGKRNPEREPIVQKREREAKREKRTTRRTGIEKGRRTGVVLSARELEIHSGR